uniref:Uncharacterized protein n=1 Tax=Magallana gigas TaxID=29159 RepID=A0A8W8N4X1_MAGGI
MSPTSKVASKGDITSWRQPLWDASTEQVLVHRRARFPDTFGEMPSIHVMHWLDLVQPILEEGVCSPTREDSSVAGWNGVSPTPEYKGLLYMPSHCTSIACGDSCPLMMLTAKSRRKDSRYTWQEDYVVSQMQLKNLKLEVALHHQSDSNIPLSCEKEIESSVEKKKSVKLNFDDPSFIEALSSADKKKETKIIQSIKQILGERKYLLRLIKKYAKGQSIAIRLNRQLTQATKELEKKIREYNILSKGQKVSTADVSELCDVDDSKNVASEAEKIKS